MSWIDIIAADVCNVLEIDDFFTVRDLYLDVSGKPANKFAFDGQAKDKEFAHGVIDAVHNQWKSLMARDADPEGVSRACTQYDCRSKISPEDAKAILGDEPPAGDDVALQSIVDKNHFVKL